MYIPEKFKEDATKLNNVQLMCKYNCSASVLYSWKKELQILKKIGRPTQPLTAEDYTLIKRYRLAGYTTTWIAHQFKIERHTLWRRLKKYKLASG